LFDEASDPPFPKKFEKQDFERGLTCFCFCLFFAIAPFSFATALDHVSLHDHPRQLNLLRLTYKLSRSVEGGTHLLSLRSQYIQQRLRHLVVASSSTLTDHIGRTYVQNVMRLFLTIIRRTSNDFHAAFQRLPQEDPKEWSTLLCALVAWVKR